MPFQLEILGMKTSLKLHYNGFLLENKIIWKEKMKNCKLNERIIWKKKKKRIVLQKAFWKNKLSSSVASSATEDGLLNWKVFYKIKIGLHLVMFVRLTNT